MILKIRDVSKKEKWVYYDKIDRISVNYSDYSVCQDGTILYEDRWSEEGQHPVDCHATYTGKSKYDDEQECIKFAIIRPDTHYNEGEMTIAFKEGYLLSDEGKTIEKL